MLSNKSTILSIALLGIAQAQLQAPCNPYTSYSGCGSGFKCSPIYGNTMQNGQCVPDTQPAICYSNKGIFSAFWLVPRRRVFVREGHARYGGLGKEGSRWP